MSFSTAEGAVGRWKANVQGEEMRAEGEGSLVNKLVMFYNG